MGKQLQKLKLNDYFSVLHSGLVSGDTQAFPTDSYTRPRITLPREGNLNQRTVHIHLEMGVFGLEQCFLLHAAQSRLLQSSHCKSRAEAMASELRGLRAQNVIKFFILNIVIVMIFWTILQIQSCRK